jgi:serine/threonine-protein kinase
MTPSPETRFERIGELLLAARELPRAERARFVRESAADAEMAAEVLDLLRGEESGGRFDALLDRFAGQAAGDGAAVDGPASIGPYRVLGVLGHGGMGAVYLAERDDGEFRNRVAIKLLRADRAGPELKRRFLAERQILARLVHRNIAWLLDGSMTGDGLPYLVMEYVDGRPLLEYCDARRLDVTRRLELFLDICAAVEYAHRRLIVHRDLKPGNILVTDDGVVKLLDFGIAKLLDAPEDASLTRTGQRVMTPDYASPEQVLGETIGTASDVYQLGVLLYELLTGRRPYRVTGSLREMEQAILTSDPPRPSAAITMSGDPGRDTSGTGRDEAVPGEPADPAKRAGARATTLSRLNRRLAGDLDQIVLKALRKEPEQRYGTATELAEEVRRHLDGRPVLARRGTVRYRASRFIRRNRMGVGAGALLFLSLVGGAAGTAWQARRAAVEARIAADERDRARVEAEKATRLASFMTSLFDVAAQGDVRTDTLRLLPVLERGAARIHDELGDQPEVQAAALIAVSDLYEKLGRFDEALRYAEESLRVRREALGPQHPDVAESLDNLGGLMMDRADIAAAAMHWGEAVDVRRALISASGPADSVVHTQLANSLHNYAVAQWRSGHLELADSLEREAIALYDAAGAGTDARMASSLDVLALVRRDQGRPEETVELTQRALDIRRAALPAVHINIAVSLNNLATGLMAVKRFDEAEPLLRESLDMRRALLGDEHPQVASAIHNLGAVLMELNRDDDAIAHYHRALAMRRELLGDDHLDIALSLSSIARLHHERKRYDQALPLFVDALTRWERGLSAEHPVVLRTRASIADCLAKTGRHAEAEPELLAAYDILVRTVGERHADTQRTRGFLRDLYTSWGRPADAARYLDPVA